MFEKPQAKKYKSTSSSETLELIIKSDTQENLGQVIESNTSSSSNHSKSKMKLATKHIAEEQSAIACLNAETIKILKIYFWTEWLE